MDALEAIRTRRSIRRYTGDPIPRADLETIVDAGRLAASGYNAQPWEFVVVTDRALIEKIALHDWIAQAGAMIAVVLATESYFWREDGSAAVQNMLVAATALGYGSCWLQGRTERHIPAIKKHLNIPADKHLMTLIPLGVPAEAPEKEKKSLAEVLHWETYQDKTG
ncbi:MAG: nitroreductase family protein [Anaerolineae bacterium]|nr:nitroreductase family protein [Anaerolineae bacterium]